MAARALTELTWGTTRAQKLADANAFATAAEAAVARLDGRPDLRLELRRAQAQLADWEGKYAEGLERLEEAERLAAQLYGPDHPQTAKVLHQVASLRMGLQEFDQVMALLARVIATYERVLGPEHPSLVAPLHNGTLTLLAMGDVETAAAWAERSLALREQVFAAGHPSLAYGLNALGEVRRRLGRGEEARPLVERSLAIREKALGPEHVLVGEPLLHLAELDAEAGRHAEARARMERTLALDEKAYGKVHPSVARGFVTLGRVLKRAGDLDGARAAYARALEVRKGGEDPDPSPLIGLGEVALAQRRPGEAVGWLEQALARAESIAQGTDGAPMLSLLCALGQAHLDGGNPGAAVAPLERALRIAVGDGDALGRRELERARTLLARAGR
jgi:tetratricopeptide (TPR) repeat protein